MKILSESIKKVLAIFIAAVVFVACDNNISEVSIIPQPQNIELNKGQFILNENTTIIVDSDDQKVLAVAKYFTNQLNIVSGYSIKVLSSQEEKGSANTIQFTDKNLDSSLDEEGYTISSNKNKIALTGTAHGLFYGVQSLFQLLPEEIYSNELHTNIDWIIPSLEIKDIPRFKWRGMHLDVGRHLFPVSFIKKYIDYIAMHKLNTFHWHLTEDQGWRIEIKKYPLLTEIGSRRKGSQIPKSNEVDNIPYSGYYTQDEIREVVAYAQERFIIVVPEIELPGHSVAALTAYPELSCTGGPFEVRSRWGISEDIYCAGNEEVFTFLEDVLSEVLELFPSKYIHIGGDEAPKTRWEECAKCQNRMKEEGLKDEHELQSYFISRIETFLNSKGRQIIGWDEILEGGLAPNAAVMSWRGIEGGISAAKQSHYVVMTPADYVYFCWYAGKPENEPPALGGFLPLEKVYAYEPIPEELSAEEQKYILGVQACLWTENIPTPEIAEYMTLPRLCALAEVAWSPKEKRNIDDFLYRMSSHYQRLDELDANYRQPGLTGFNKKNIFIDTVKVDFISSLNESEIRYTMDGTIPTRESLLYTGTFTLSKTTIINLIEYSSSGKSSPVYEVQYLKHNLIEAKPSNEPYEELSYEYFEFQEPINSTIDLLEMNAVSKAKIATLIYPFEDSSLPNKFGLIYKGFIKIPEDGLYTFSVFSNDGSVLYIADSLAVDNDGSHWSYEKDGDIALQKGLHKIQLSYFQSGGAKDLKVSWKGPGFEKRELVGKDFFIERNITE